MTDCACASVRSALHVFRVVEHHLAFEFATEAAMQGHDLILREALCARSNSTLPDCPVLGVYSKMDRIVGGMSTHIAPIPRIDRGQLHRGAHFQIEDLFGIRLGFLYS
jgi:hypothetical protein